MLLNQFLCFRISPLLSQELKRIVKSENNGPLFCHLDNGFVIIRVKIFIIC